MKRIPSFSLILLLSTGLTKAQNPLLIPDTLSGTTINLRIADSTRQIFNGFNTNTNAYNGSFLGPTIILHKGQNVTLNVKNALSDTTTTHWHGLHVAPVNDGSPHTPILSNSTWSPSFLVKDHAATYWYHPHLHGKTMKQVLKGAAGLIIVRDSVESNLVLPRTYGIDDIPLVCQFLRFDSVSKQIKLDDDIDNTVLINGRINPVVNLPAQIIRLRLLNASSHRFFDFGFNDSRNFFQITSDDGLLDAPVTMNRLTLGPGERAEILVDFSSQQGNTYYLKQFGTQLPAGYPAGPPSQMGGMPAGPLDNTNFNLLTINVQVPSANPVTSIPSILTNNSIWPQVGAFNRNISITASPMNSMTNFLINGSKYNMAVINFTTQQNNTEIWNITNQSMMPHPFHVHGNHFYVLSVNGAAPPANMQGRKDVVVVPPQNGSVKLITRYEDFSDPMLPYMYHCHILSHEDNGMMGQFIVGALPNPTGITTTDEEVNSLLIYPNPVRSVLHVKSEGNAMSEISIYNLLGELIQNVPVGEKSNEMIDISALKSGIYLITIRAKNGQLNKKIVIE